MCISRFCKHKIISHKIYATVSTGVWNIFLRFLTNLTLIYRQGVRLQNMAVYGRPCLTVYYYAMPSLKYIMQTSSYTININLHDKENRFSIAFIVFLHGGDKRLTLQQNRLVGQDREHDECAKTYG